MQRSVVAMMAHADDIEYCAGGTFARYASEGHRMLYGVLSRCNSGWTKTEKTVKTGGLYTASLDIVPQRRAEAKAAAAVFGAELYQGDFLENCYTRRDGARVVPSFTGAAGVSGERIAQDRDLPAGTLLAVAAGAGASWKDNPFAREIADLLVQWEPELVIGQEFTNFNPVPDEFQFPPLVPTDFVDVTGHEERCIEAMSCHRSQGGHLGSTHAWLRANWSGWGAKRRVKSAEAFCAVYRQ
jgi:LmbE family N-acetylglucosaminyl deacetylase